MTDFDLSAGGQAVPVEPSDEFHVLRDQFSAVVAALEARVEALESHLARQTGYTAPDPYAPVVPVTPVEG